MNRARQREDLAPLLVGKSRGNQRATLQRRFDDQATAANSADDTIAARLTHSLVLSAGYFLDQPLQLEREQKRRYNVRAHA